MQDMALNLRVPLVATDFFTRRATVQFCRTGPCRARRRHFIRAPTKFVAPVYKTRLAKNAKNHKIDATISTLHNDCGATTKLSMHTTAI